MVVDDDLSILRVWKGRFASLGIHNFFHFSSGETFSAWFKTEGKNGTYKFFLDYELVGSSETGLDLIENFSLSEPSLLVTSRFEEESIRERAFQIGVKILPKGLAAFIPIEVLRQNNGSSPHAILLDNDINNQLLWKIAAKKKQKNLLLFSHAQALFNALSSIPLETEIYIDSHLGDGEPKGEDVAKDLFERGYRNLFLTTEIGRAHV